MSSGIDPERTLLPIVLAADNFPASPYDQPYPLFNPTTGERYIPFHLTFADYQANLPPVGYLRPEVINDLLSDERDAETCPWQAHSSASGAGEEDEDMELDLKVECVFFADWVVRAGSEEMGRVMQETAIQWRAGGKFPEQLGGELLVVLNGKKGKLKPGWRNEKYRVYAAKSSSALKIDGNVPFSNFAFALERSACAIFGFATFGVHLTGMSLWLKRKAKISVRGRWERYEDLGPSSFCNETNVSIVGYSLLIKKLSRHAGQCEYCCCLEHG